MMIVAFALHGVCPIIKNIWTSTFALFSGGFCVALLGLLMPVSQVTGVRQAFWPARIFGENPLLAYDLVFLIAPLIDYNWFGTETAPLSLRGFGHAGREFRGAEHGVAVVRAMRAGGNLRGSGGVSPEKMDPRFETVALQSVRRCSKRVTAPAATTPDEGCPNAISRSKHIPSTLRASNGENRGAVTYQREPEAGCPKNASTVNIAGAYVANKVHPAIARIPGRTAGIVGAGRIALAGPLRAQNTSSYSQ